MFAPWYVAFISLLFGFILLSLSIQIYNKKQILGQSFFWLLLLFDSLFSFTLGIYYLIGEITQVDSTLMSFITFGLVYSLIYFTAVLWFFYCALYSGRPRYVTPKYIALFGGLMAIGCIFRFLDMLNLPVESSGQKILSELIFCGHYAAAYYFFILIIIGIYFLLQRYETVSHRFKSQIAFLVIGISILLLTRLALETVLKGYHTYGFDVGVSGLFLAFGVLHYNLLEFSPVFRDRFFTLNDHGLLALNQKSEIIDMNPAAERILNTRMRDAFGKAASDIPSIPEPFIRYLTDPDTIDQASHFPVYHQGTHWYQMTSRITDTTVGADETHLITIADITQTISLEQEIQKTRVELLQEKEKIKQEQRYHQYFVSYPDAILICSKGQIIDCNPAALDMFQVPKQDLLATDLSSLSSPRQFNPDDIPEKLVYYISKANTGSLVTFSWIFLAGDTKIEAEVRLSRLDHDDTSLVEMIILDMSTLHARQQPFVQFFAEQEKNLGLETSLWQQVSSLIQDPAPSQEEKERAFKRIYDAAQKNLKRLSDHPTL
ncbi:PAS domain-containing protein [uncultured Methanospirillum sp.]|uniref:PAS domain-containing protein n=1 Tax=uncultured Methanospirillum sp. TaxID=262503 RepID=UPI0029C9A7A3|nr:PAS domain-containing protein [uncultured Methanospirillum sp.]